MAAAQRRSKVVLGAPMTRPRIRGALARLIASTDARVVDVLLAPDLTRAVTMLPPAIVDLTPFAVALTDGVEDVRQ